MAEPKLIKVCLTNKGEDTETPWAHDLGAAAGPTGSRKVKLVNVPFMHAKPTWGDTIVVSPVADGFPTWDRDGAPWKQIGSRLVEDGGRWAMIVDYAPHEVSADAAFQALGKACDAIKVVCEGAWGPRDAEPGRVYLAVQKDLTAELVMQKLEAVKLPCRLIQVHPEPKRASRANTQIGIAIEPARTPAAPTPSEGVAVVAAAKKPAPRKPPAAPPSPPATPPAPSPAAKAPVASAPAAKAAAAAKPPAAKVPVAAKAPPAPVAAKAPPAPVAAKAPPAPAAKVPAAKVPAAKARPAPAAKAAVGKAPAAKAAAGKAPAEKPAAKVPAGKPAAKAAPTKPAAKKLAPKKR